MKKTVVYIFLLCLVILIGCSESESIKNSVYENNNENFYDITMKQDILCLMMAYSEYITDIERDKNKNVYIVMKSGRRILYDDRKEKALSEKQYNPDLQDMMEQIYPLSNIKDLMEENFDPGRIRVYPLLKEVYGESKAQTQSNLVNVKVGYKNYPFSNKNNAANELKAVMQELLPLANKDWKVYNNVFPASGTYNYRYIAGTNRLSAHSFGIAIDLKRDERDYWKWANREKGEKRISEYPQEIVRIFEKHNFIWGGKWGHFDILHFEYRPELIIKARYFSSKLDFTKLWYKGVSSSDKDIRNYIQLIDDALK